MPSQDWIGRWPHMRIQQTSRIITASVVLLSLLTIASGFVSQEFRKQQEQNYAARRVALQMAPQLAAGSDRLTNTARAYAATGEPRYYEDFVRERDVRKCLRDHWGTGAVLSSARGESAGGAEPEFAGSAGWQSGREHRLSGGEFGDRRSCPVVGEVSAGCAGS